VTAFSLSVDAAFDSSDLALEGVHAVGALAPGTSSTASTSLTIPAGLAPGSYYVFARTDAGGDVIETSETNNTRWWFTRIGPDLAVSTASLPSSIIQAGATGTVSDTVVNQGAGLAAPSTTLFYLSTNSLVDAGDVLLPGSRPVPALATGASSSGSTVITIPLGTAPGTYYLLADADGAKAVAESLETNNARFVRAVQVTAP